MEKKLNSCAIHKIHKHIGWRGYSSHSVRNTFPPRKKSKRGETGPIRSDPQGQGGSARQCESAVRLPNSQRECRTVLDSDGKYNIF